MNVDIDHLRGWLGKTESRTETMGVSSVTGLSATLDRDDPHPAAGDAVPPLWHWLYFLPQALQREIGADGHPRRGGFLPPVPLPRRMWAGGRVDFARSAGGRRTGHAHLAHRSRRRTRRAAAARWCSCACAHEICAMPRAWR